LVVSRKTVAKS